MPPLFRATFVMVLLALLHWLPELRAERKLVLRNTLLALKTGRESHS